jgi:hypothetical protein
MDKEIPEDVKKEFNNKILLGAPSLLLQLTKTKKNFDEFIQRHQLMQVDNLVDMLTLPVQLSKASVLGLTLTAREETIPELLKMDMWTRYEIEQSVAADVAEELFRRLPRTQKDFDQLIASGGKLGAEMGWDAVSRNFVLPGMDRAMEGTGGAGGRIAAAK